AGHRGGRPASRQRGVGIGIRQVPCQRSRCTPRRQSTHRRADSDRRLPRAAIHGRQRAEERGEGPLSLTLRFGDTLAARVAERESQIVRGLEPGPSDLWPGSAPAAQEQLPTVSRVGMAVLGQCHALIDATAEACVAVKLQLARFEALGAVGWTLLGAVADHARELGLLVIADGKRGDIDVSARAYANALIDGLVTPFGKLDGLGADLVTVNPLMGADAIAPFIAA